MTISLYTTGAKDRLNPYPLLPVHPCLQQIFWTLFVMQLRQQIHRKHKCSMTYRLIHMCNETLSSSTSLFPSTNSTNCIYSEAVFIKMAHSLSKASRLIPAAGQLTNGAQNDDVIAYTCTSLLFVQFGISQKVPNLKWCTLHKLITSQKLLANLSN